MRRRSESCKLLVEDLNESELMKAVQNNSALDGIKKEQLKRRVFKLEFKAEVVRHKKAENLTLAECGRKFEVLPKLVQHWQTQYDAGQLTVAAGRRAVSPEKAEITRLRAELSRAKMEVRILKKPWCTLQKRASEVHLYPRRTDDVTMSVVCPMLGVTQSGLHFWRRRERQCASKSANG